VNVDPNNSTSRNAYQAGVNYVIDGHNALISLNYVYGDIATKGLNYTSTATGDNVNSIIVGFQWQI
jgi:hypothetical protein